MEAVLGRTWRPLRSEALETYWNWLLCWAVLPNAPFALLWVVGGPARLKEILITGSIGLLLHRAPYLFKLIAFLGVFTYSAFVFLAGTFNLHVNSFIASIRFAMEMDPATSPQYLVGFGAFVITVCVALRLLRRSTVLAAPAFLVAAMGLTVGAAALDRLATAGSQGHYSRSAAEGALFTSGVKASGLAGLATGERHVIVVMVEAMGLPTDPELRRRMTDIWARPEVRARYDVVTGETFYYGSTTSGEMRELCGRWGDYQEVMERADPGCLPAALARRGYRTAAWHSFTGEFFDRTSWYPNIGFEEMRFVDRLKVGGAEICPGVFPGACDWQVPAQIAKMLKAADEPQFVYWLTLNSHLPVLKTKKLGTEECASFDRALDASHPMICRLLQLFDQTGAALGKEITAADFPDADILIVGDHIPPFFDRPHRTQFAADRVPWILLRAKPRAAP